MLAIYKKELKSHFHSVIGWLVVAAILFYVSLFYVAYNMMNLNPYISNALNSAGLVFLFAIPILTMKILADERKSKTDQLILTAPISIFKIILGKYLALLTIFLVPTLVVCTYPLVMSRFGAVPFLQSYVAILGFFLYGATCIAIGLFLSSITENQIIAAVLTFVTLFVTYIMSSICSMISASGNLLTKVLSKFDLYEYFVSFLDGTFSVKSLVFFLSLIILFLFLTCQSIQKRRWNISSKTLKISAFSTGSIILSVLIFAAINGGVLKLPASVLSIDVTPEKLYGITDDTKTELKNLEEDITIYVLATEADQDKSVLRTLSQYQELSNHIKIEYRDQTNNPTFASKYTTESLETNSIIVESEKRNKVIPYASLYVTTTDYTTYESKTTGYDAEGQLTSAIAYVTSDDMPKMYAITGHDELSLGTTFADAVAKENIELETINLMNYDVVPEDAECLFILAPISDFSQQDAEKVMSYLQKGGKAFIVSTYTDKEMTNFNSMIESYGVKINPGIVAEENQNNYYQNAYFLLPDVQSNTLTDGIYNQKYVLAPYSQGITVTVSENDAALTVSPLLQTSDQSFSETNVSNVNEVQKDASDIAGPFSIGVIAKKTDQDMVSEIALFSCENIFTDETNNAVSGANLQLFSNVIGNMVEHETLVSIPAKSYEGESLIVPQRYFIFIAIMSVIVVPVLLIVFGLVIWIRRKRK